MADMAVLPAVVRHVGMLDDPTSASIWEERLGTKIMTVDEAKRQVQVQTEQMRKRARWVCCGVVPRRFS